MTPTATLTPFPPPTDTPTPSHTATATQTTTPNPITPIPVSLQVINTHTPTPTIEVELNLPNWKAKMIETARLSNGGPVDFHLQCDAFGGLDGVVHLSAVSDPPWARVNVVPQVLSLPGSAIVTFTPPGNITRPASFRITVTAQAGDGIQVMEMSVNVDPGAVVVQDGGFWPTDTVPIYLTTDSRYDEQVGDVVRVGGRIGLGPPVDRVEVIARRGKGSDFTGIVPIPRGKSVFVIEVPVETQAMLEDIWTVDVQFSLPTAAGAVSWAGQIQIPVGAANQNAAPKSPTEIGKTSADPVSVGRFLAVGGAASSSLLEETITRLLSERYTDMVRERRFDERTLKVFSSRPLEEVDGNVSVPDPLVPSNNELLTQLALVPTDESLVLYLLGHSPARGTFLLRDGEELDIDAVGTALALHAQDAPTLVVVDCDFAGALAQTLYDTAGAPAENLLMAASTGSGTLSIAIFGTAGSDGTPVSFSDFFWDQISQSASTQGAFRIAFDRLLELQGPLVLQIPELIPDPGPDNLLASEVGSPHVEDLSVADVPDNNEPSFIQGPSSQSHVRNLPLVMDAVVSDDRDTSSQVMAHISLRDDPSTYVDRVMQPIQDATGEFRVEIDRFPGSLFDSNIASATQYLFSLLAEDGDRNAADPYLTSVNVESTDLLVDGFDVPRVLVTPVGVLRQGVFEAGVIPAPSGSEVSTDGTGIKITVVDGEGVGLLLDNLLELHSDGPVRFTVNVHASAPGAEVALAFFNMPLSGEPDGRLAYSQVRGNAIPANVYTPLDLIYQPPDGRGFVYLQVVQTMQTGQRMEVSFDNLLVDPSPDLSRTRVPLDFDATFSSITTSDLNAGGIYLANLNPTDTGIAEIGDELLRLSLDGDDLAANFATISPALDARLPGFPLILSAEFTVGSPERVGFTTLMLTNGEQDFALFQNVVDITGQQRLEVGGTMLRASSQAIPPIIIVQNADVAAAAITRLDVDNIVVESFSLSDE